MRFWDTSPQTLSAPKMKCKGMSRTQKEKVTCQCVCVCVFGVLGFDALMLRIQGLTAGTFGAWVLG